MNATLIHNPAISYFHMVLTQTFFGRSENTDTITKEELFIMFSVFQSRPINSTTFLFANLDKISQSTQGPILVGEIATSITFVVGLQNQVAHLVPVRSHNLIDINHFLNKALIRVRGPNEYQLLINNDIVHHFTLPNHELTRIHNCENWLYPWEGQGETLELPQTPLVSDYHLDHPFDISYSSSSACPPNPHGHNVEYEFDSLRQEVFALHQTLHDQFNRMTKQMDHLL